MNSQINKLVYKHKKDKWLNVLKKASFFHGPKNLWKITKNLMTPQNNNKNNVINFDKPVSDPKRCANEFNKQFTPDPGKQDRSFRQTKRKFKQNPCDYNLEIADSDVTAATKKIKTSKAMGPDNLSPIILKHLGTKGITFITKLLNLSLQTLTIPYSWKTARIIPILKPEKNPELGSSYRPISLLSPVAKVLESLLLPLLSDKLIM